MSTNETRAEKLKRITAQRADEINLLSSGSTYSIGSGDKAKNKVMKSLFKENKDGSINEKLRFDKNKIAGNYKDLQEQFDSAMKSSRPASVEDMMRIRQTRAARDRSATSRWLGKGGDNHLMRGGGASNIYMFGSHEAFSIAGAGDHMDRMLKFARGYGMTDDIMNGLGMLTKHQKNIIASPSQSLRNKLFAGVPAALGGVFSMAEAVPYMTGEKESTLSDNAAVSMLGLTAQMAAGTYAFRVSKEATHMATSLIPKFSKQGEALGMASKARGYLKFGIGAGVGIAAGITAALGVGAAVDIFKESANTDNSINRVKRKLYRGDILGDTSITTNQLLTGRQRAVQKLSKSALNDRGSILGNEAMIMKGIF